MPNVSRPDLLPLARPVRIGLDKHGLVQNQVLAGNVYSIAAGNGEARSVAGQTTATGSGGFQQYALISGKNSQIGGAALTRTKFVTEEWIYSDSRYSWRVKLALTHNYTTHELTLTLTLVSSFGVLTDKNLAMTPRTLATLTWKPQSYDGTNAALKVGTELSYHKFLLTHSRIGDKAFANVGKSGSTIYDLVWFSTAIYPVYSTDPALGIHDCIKILITGDGSIVPGHVGAGISATITRDHPATSFLKTSTSSSSESGQRTTTLSVNQTSATEVYATPCLCGSTIEKGAWMPDPPDECFSYSGINYPCAVGSFYTEVASVFGDTEDESTTYSSSASSLATYDFLRFVLPDGTETTGGKTISSNSNTVFSASVQGSMTWADASCWQDEDGPYYTKAYFYDNATPMTGSAEETRTTQVDFSLTISGTTIATTKKTTRADSKTAYAYSSFSIDPSPYLVQGTWGPNDTDLSLSVELVSNIQDTVDYAPSVQIPEDYILYATSTVFGVLKVYPTAQQIMLCSIDGTTYDLGSGLGSGENVSYEPELRQFAKGASVVWV